MLILYISTFFRIWVWVASSARFPKMTFYLNLKYFETPSTFSKTETVDNVRYFTFLGIFNLQALVERTALGEGVKSR